MATIAENRDLACYFTTKHSWKGKYKRVFSVGTHGITTYNPTNMEVTNQWPYGELVGIGPIVKAPGNNEFNITLKKSAKKNDCMRFSTDHRADLLTDALKFQKMFADADRNPRRFNAFKYHWSDCRVPVVLEVNYSSLDQIDPSSQRVLCSFFYKDIEGLTQVSDISRGVAVIYGGFRRLHLFSLEAAHSELVQCVVQTATACVGIAIRQGREPITFDQFQLHRLGKYSTDEALTSYAEFTVQKISVRHSEAVRRTLCLTELCVVERDPATYNVVTVKPFCDLTGVDVKKSALLQLKQSIFAINRDPDNPQKVAMEYVRGVVCTYLSTNRDALIASILDGVRASGNRDVCVKMSLTCRGYRLSPFTVSVDEEVEVQHMKFIQAPPSGISFEEAVNRFNVNVAYSGLLHAVTAEGLFAQNKVKLINSTLIALIDQEDNVQSALSVHALEAEFHAIRRLVASKAGFQAFTELPRIREKLGLKVVRALKRDNVGVTHAAIDMLCALMQPMHDNYDLRQEQLNKSSLLSSPKFLERLVEIFIQNVVQESGSLVIMAMLDFLTFALCSPYSETTDDAQFDSLLELTAANGRSIFKLFQHPSMAIVKGAGLVMKAIIEEGDTEIAAKMQDLALAEGALPRHLHTALFTSSTEGRMLTCRQLSRHLVGLWVTGHPTAMGLLKRILPSGLLGYLDSHEEVPVVEADCLHVRDNLKSIQDNLSKNKRNVQLIMIEKKIDMLLQHWKSRIGLEKKQALAERPIILRKRRQRIKIEANWPLFYYQFHMDHARPNLLWNFRTREELREAFENEMRSFDVDRELGSSCVISWNHAEFEVPYRCLSEEIKIGDYYLRLLLEESEESDESIAIKKSHEFFNDLYHRFLLTSKTAMKCMCLQALTIVYGRCHAEIGAFNDTRYIVAMLDRCTDRSERDRLLYFINKLILHKRNVKEILNSNGIKVLVDLLTLAHLHISRATIPLQTNVIEASPDMERSSEKEWYFGNVEKERLGPCSLLEMKDHWDQGTIHPKTRCWAQGMDGWRPLLSVPQLKWTFLASGQSIMNESEMAMLILSMLIKMAEYYPSRDADGAVVRPVPLVKRILSDAMCLPHVVQLFLTFDPIIVEKTATLLYLVMLDNPSVSRLYLSGAIFFIMMYTGSNLLPIARLLKYTHMRQAFRSDENKSSNIMMCSVLGHILPEAMVCYLENYSSEKFAEIFLGEFDTPEAIWSAEMRRMMIERIARHIADFSPRLQSNTRALYQYCPIPVIGYPQLDNELFCNIFYLKHLCNTGRFPDWPIEDPIKLLKDILDAWKKEVEKKPPSMSVEDAFKVLNLPETADREDNSKIRKAYFKLAQKYHPDKNPEGREMFEVVNRAYEFLCNNLKIRDGPDPQNIYLILCTQSILFSRYPSVLELYKYAGYPMLIRTITLETEDDQLFSKVIPLLSAAAELAYYTVKCSALNAEELRRENGIQVLHNAFSRCVSVLCRSSQPDCLAVQVCVNVSKCYAVAAQFAGCREKIQECPGIVRDLCRILYFKDLGKLCTVVSDCVSRLCIDFWLQTNFFQCGVVWHLLPNFFNYDYTLDEGGVERSQESNQQEVSNRLAKRCVFACACLGGYRDDKGEEPVAPNNPAVRKSLRAMLTPFLARKLADPEPAEFLKLFNSNTENPYLIWDNATRTQLSEYLADSQSRLMHNGEIDNSLGADFEFDLHVKELVVGEIFVRIFNEQPAFPLEMPREFTVDLLNYLGSQAQYLHSLMLLQKKGQFLYGADQTQRLASIEMALEALRNVMKSYPGAEIQCIGYFKLLFSLLRLEKCGSLQCFTLEVLSCVTVNQECVKDIAATEVLGYLLFSLYNVQQAQLLTLETLFTVMSNTKVVKEALAKGALIYFLDLFCNSTNPIVREKTAELLAKMLADKLVGRKVCILLTKFLPGIFMDAMRDSASASVHMFENSHENPELIWNDESREKVCESVKCLAHSVGSFFSRDYSEVYVGSHLQCQRVDTETRWQMRDDLAVVYADTQGEVVVGGVFLRLFISNSGWVLRRPKEFFAELLEKWNRITSVPSPDNEMLEMVTTAIVCLSSTQPSMLDNVPQLGYMQKVFQVMTADNDALPMAAMQLAYQFSTNELCVRNLTTFECFEPVKIGMKARSDAIFLAAEMFARIFDRNVHELVDKALKANLVQFLLCLLEGGMEAVENRSATKAHIVKALKAMLACQQHGQQVVADKVSEILEKSPVWKEYRDQLHDLFITDTNIAGYLTGPNVAGYLTASSMRSLPDTPPPLNQGRRK